MEVAVGIVAQRDNERAQALAARLVEALEGARDGEDAIMADVEETASEEVTAGAGVENPDATVVIDEATGEAVDATAVPVASMTDRDLVVSIGGDGTLLFVAREVGPTPILGVNLGEVGFLNAVAPEDAVSVVTDLVADYRAAGRFEGRELARLEATTPDADWTLEPALNEIVVHGPRRGHGGGATVEIAVDGERYAESHADGVLVATPTGSTAYNLSEGGPLVHPGTDALVVNQMAAADAMPPLVVDPGTDLTLAISNADTAFVISDGRNRRRLEPPATVDVSIAADPVRLVGPRGKFATNLEKLD
ncbi:NAD(+) kinase [Natronorubrum sp. JWXQ-INN-674]|uniref:NAD kinase n=1 Tax=Natronorubrum halalkaliphilum TaxID=2691917 RepID=A0A6B0VHB8_9EURY|nr:NAD(+)/NADH kinase [Natronorubrum halalkaliphilum]MXV60938.1 NAD(+) kinase [Natronorubrum halalkaliphilum]